jgi:hypothetical protein
MDTTFDSENRKQLHHVGDGRVWAECMFMRIFIGRLF